MKMHLEQFHSKPSILNLESCLTNFQSFNNMFIKYCKKCHPPAILYRFSIYLEVCENKTTSYWPNHSLANKKLCYFKIYKILENKTKIVLENAS